MTTGKRNGLVAIDKFSMEHVTNGTGRHGIASCLGHVAMEIGINLTGALKNPDKWPRPVGNGFVRCFNGRLLKKPLSPVLI